MPLTYMNLTTCTGSSHKAGCIISSLANRCSQELNLDLQFRNGITMPNYVNLAHLTCTPYSSDGSISHCFRRWKDAYQVDQGSQTYQDQAAHHGGTTGFQQHESFRLYRAITRACPRQKAKRIHHLKNDAGEFLTPPEETAAYVQFIQDNRSGPSFDPPDLPVPGVPFNLRELEQVIATVPSTKAVVPGFAPGPLWKSQWMFIAE